VLAFLSCALFSDDHCDEHVLTRDTFFAPPFMPLAYKNKLNWI